MMKPMLSRMSARAAFWLALIMAGLAWGRPAAAEALTDILVSAANRQTQFKCELDKAGALKLVFNERSGGAGELTLTNQWSLEGGTALNDLKLQDARKHDLPVAGIDWTERSASTGLLLEYTLDLAGADEGRMGAADLRVRVTNQGKAPIALRWRQQIAGLPAEGKIFGPSGQDFYEFGPTSVVLGYRDSGHTMTIPMATVYNRETGAGYTMAAHLETPLPPFRFQYDAPTKKATLQRVVLALPPNESRTVRQFVVRHAGDWRPGLAFVREKNARFFMYADPKWRDMVGCFAYSNIGDAAFCRQLAKEGVKNVEIHWNYSSLGVYLPEEDPWVPVIDDKWTAIKRTTDPAVPSEDASYEKIKAYVKKVCRPVGSAERVRKFIRELHKNGIHAFTYFQATEEWEFFAQTHYPEAIRRRPDGTPVLTWYDHVVMNCRPETRWGQYICSQLERILDMYPEVDGVFMDQSAGDGNDYAVTAITDKLARIVESRGKTCYWNGPYMVELAEHASGMLAEGGSMMAERIKFLTIGDKTCCGFATSERQYQRNLINGLWPAAASQVLDSKYRYSDDLVTPAPIDKTLESYRYGDELVTPGRSDKALAKRHQEYMRLFELYGGKTWVLEADPIALPEGAQGNIFQRPDGDYLVALVYPHRMLGDGSVDEDAHVTVRVSGADKMSSAYLRVPDVPGQFKLEMTRQRGALHVTLPWVGSAGLVWLSGREQPSEAMPAPPQSNQQIKAEAAADKGKVVMSAQITMEGFVPTGVWFDSLTTTAPKPPIPVRKAFINGHPIGTLSSRNYRSWHFLVGIAVSPDAVNDLKLKDNELLIVADHPDDFFMLRNLRLTIMFADGRVIRSEVMKGPWASCPNPKAVGTIGSPIRIRFDVQGL